MQRENIPMITYPDFEIVLFFYKSIKSFYLRKKFACLKAYHLRGHVIQHSQKVKWNGLEKLIHVLDL